MRRKKTDDGAVHHAKTNGATEEMCKGFVSEHEDEQIKIDNINRDAVKAAAPYRARQVEIAKEAAESGVPKKVFNARINERKKLRDAALIRDGLNEDQKIDFDNFKAKTQMPLPGIFQEEAEEEAEGGAGEEVA